MMVLGPLTARPRKTPRRRPSLRPRPELLEDRLAPAAGGALAGLGGPYYLENVFGVEPPDGDYLLGGAVAVSGDGQTVAVASTIARDMEGGPVGGPYFAGAGSVSVYSRADQGWGRSAEIPFLDRESTDLILTKGVFLSDDGDRMVVVVGSQLSRNPLSLHILDHSEGGWTTTEVVTVPNGTSMGTVAMSGDGHVIAVGLPYELGEGAVASGLVRIYSDRDGVWGQSVVIPVPESIGGGGFGRSVSLSGDGRTLVASGYDRVESASTTSGIVYVFDDEGTGWDLATHFESPGDYVFGQSTALSRDGDRLLVRGLGPGEAGPFTNGVVHVYANGPAGWRPEATLASPDGYPGLGSEISIDADGSTAAIASAAGPGREGRVYLFGRTGSTWGHFQTLSDLQPDERGSNFGDAVAIAGDVVVVGDPLKRVGGTSGSAFLYEIPRSFKIVVSPVDQIAHPGTATWFTAAAAGAEAISTQWQVSTDAGATWEDVPGATSPWLLLSPSLADSGRTYRAVFVDGDGTTLVSPPATLTVAKATPVLSIEGAPFRFNEEGVFTVRLATDGATTAVPGGGLVRIQAGAYSALNVAVDGVVRFVIPPGTLTPGVVQVSASYDGLGDLAFGAGSATVDFVVMRGSVTLALSSNPPGPYYGQSLRLVASVMPEGPGTQLYARPTGFVSFYNRGLGPIISEVLSTPPGAADLETWAVMMTGNEIWARYGGDEWYEPATSAVLAFDAASAPTVVVPMAITDFNVPISTYGDRVVYRVYFMSESRYAPTGVLRVTVEDDAGDARSFDYPVTGQGPQDIQLNGLSVGGQKVTFEFSDPAGRFLPFSYTAYRGVWKAPSVVRLKSYGGVSEAGETVRFDAQVIRPGTKTTVDSGWVEFYVGLARVATVPVGSVGFAVLTTSALVPGVYTISAVYLESENYQASEPVHIVHQVKTPREDKRATVTTVTTSGASTFGDPVAFTATVTASDGGKGPSSGGVAFYVGGTLVAFQPLGADGRSTLTTTALVPGVYSVAAAFFETDPFLGSLSTAVPHVVSPVPIPQIATSVHLSSTANPSIAGQPLAFIAQVFGAAGPLRDASGLVRFYLRGTLIAERPLDAEGRAVLNARFDATGGYFLSAEYVGDGRYGTSRSETLGQAVLPLATPSMPPGQVAPDSGSPARQEPSRRERLLAAARERQAARTAARAEALARLARRRPPAMRAGR